MIIYLLINWRSTYCRNTSLPNISCYYVYSVGNLDLILHGFYQFLHLVSMVFWCFLLKEVARLLNCKLDKLYVNEFLLWLNMVHIISCYCCHYVREMKYLSLFSFVVLVETRRSQFYFKWSFNWMVCCTGWKFTSAVPVSALTGKKL